jgi:hypothetical protein
MVEERAGDGGREETQTRYFIQYHFISILPFHLQIVGTVTLIHRLESRASYSLCSKWQGLAFIPYLLLLPTLPIGAGQDSAVWHVPHSARAFLRTVEAVTSHHIYRKLAISGASVPAAACSAAKEGDLLCAFPLTCLHVGPPYTCSQTGWYSHSVALASVFLGAPLQPYFLVRSKY